MNEKIVPNNIYHGDAYELIKQLPDNSVDLIITDPPYEYVNGGGGGCFGIKKKGYHKEYLKVSKNHNSINKRKLSSRYEISHLTTGLDYSILDDFVRIMKKINIYIFCTKHMIQDLMNYFINKDCNFDVLVWCKTNPLPTSNNTYHNDTEYILFFRDKGVKVFGDYTTKFKYYLSSINIDDKKNFSHPTIKPLDLVKRYILNSSSENDVVLDPFLGSGTTAVAAKELGRRYIGFEIDKDYFKIAKDRLNGINANGQTSVFTDFDLIEE